MKFNATLIWFLLGLVLIILEFAVPDGILVFFGIVAWLAAATTYLGLTVTCLAHNFFMDQWLQPS